jgi:peptide/nickel transport system substrate-binding protein
MKSPASTARVFALLIGSAWFTVGFAIAPANTLSLQWMGEIETLDPHQAFNSNNTDVLNNVYDTLITFERNTTKLAPMLATEWKPSSDGKTITLSLRGGVKFHSGNDFTCKDAEYSLRRLLVTNNASSPASYLSDSIVGFQYWNEKLLKNTPFSSISKAVSCDAKNKLVIKLSRPDPVFLMRLTGTWGSILDSKAVIAAGEWDGTEATWKDWRNKDVGNSSLNKTDFGSGAYSMVARESEQAIFKANPNYWGEKPKLENVVLKTVKDDSSRVLAIKSGDADQIAYGNPSAIKQVQNAPGVTLHRLPSTSVSVLFFNFDIVKGGRFVGSGKLDGKGIPSNFFADLNVRRGFAAAMDQQRIIKEVMAGLGEQRTMTLPKIINGYDASIKTIQYDLEQSRKYFRAAFNGEVWKKGFVFEALIDTGDGYDQAFMGLLKSALTQVNPKFQMRIKAMPQSDRYATLATGTAPLTSDGSSAEVPDPFSMHSFFYSSQGTFSGHTHFKDTQLDKHLSELAVAQTPTQRAKIASSIGRRANEIQALIVLPSTQTTYVTRSNLKGIPENYNPFRFTRVFWNSLSK